MKLVYTINLTVEEHFSLDLKVMVSLAFLELKIQEKGILEAAHFIWNIINIYLRAETIGTILKDSLRTISAI